jgi:hypothetical protein
MMAGDSMMESLESGVAVRVGVVATNRVPARVPATIRIRSAGVGGF